MVVEERVGKDGGVAIYVVELDADGQSCCFSRTRRVNRRQQSRRVRSRLLFTGSVASWPKPPVDFSPPKCRGDANLLEKI